MSDASDQKSRAFVVRRVAKQMHNWTNMKRSVLSAPSQYKWQETSAFDSRVHARTHARTNARVPTTLCKPQQQQRQCDCVEGTGTVNQLVSHEVIQKPPIPRPTAKEGENHMLRV